MIDWTSGTSTFWKLLMIAWVQLSSRSPLSFTFTSKSKSKSGNKHYFLLLFLFSIPTCFAKRRRTVFKRTAAAPRCRGQTAGSAGSGRWGETHKTHRLAQITNHQLNDRRRRGEALLPRMGQMQKTRNGSPDGTRCTEAWWSLFYNPKAIKEMLGTDEWGNVWGKGHTVCLWVEK